MKTFMLQNHIGIADVSKAVFSFEQLTPGLNQSQDAVLDLKVASSLEYGRNKLIGLCEKVEFFFFQWLVS